MWSKVSLVIVLLVVHVQTESDNGSSNNSVEVESFIKNTAAGNAYEFSKSYSNRWTAHIEGGESVAKLVAKEIDCHYIAHVVDGKYIFFT